MSGTYRCPDVYAFQAGLPLDRFYVVHEKKENCCDSDPNTIIIPDTNTVLKRVLSFSEVEFAAYTEEWRRHLDSFLATDAAVAACHKTLTAIIAQRQAAVDAYGYLSEVDMSRLSVDSEASVGSHC